MDGSPGISILIVEDDETIRETLIQILEDEGYAVFGAIDGRHALEFLHSATPAPSLIMLDLMMPTMNGWEFHAELRSLPGHATTPVLLVSADANVAEKARGIDHVAALRKPFDVDALLNTISDLCPRAAS